MKRFHVHLSVDNLDQHIAFYNQLFAAPARVIHDDYAKWELDDPAVNFVLSSRGHVVGLNHLGIQFDDEEKLMDSAPKAENTTCCYANSKKHWTFDPSGIPWEQYVTMGQTEYYTDDSQQSGKCCVSDQASGSCC